MRLNEKVHLDLIFKSVQGQLNPNGKEEKSSKAKEEDPETIHPQLEDPKSSPSEVEESKNETSPEKLIY